MCTASNVVLSSWTCACKLCSELLSELTWGAVVLGALCGGAPAPATAPARHAIATSSALFETERILDRFIDTPAFLIEVKKYSGIRFCAQVSLPAVSAMRTSAAAVERCHYILLFQ